MGASIIAVVGTLLGSGVTYTFQQRAARRNEQFTRDEKLRQERLDAYSSFAGKLVDYRRSLMERWLQQHGEMVFDNDEPALRKHSYELRTAAEEALFRLQMLTDDEQLVRRSQEVLDCVGEIFKATDRADWDVKRTAAKAAIHGFVAVAKHTLTEPPGNGNTEPPVPR
ncbi:hypothetical protein ACWD4B_19085 [Streptomyces sp. NPDC002536]